MLVARRLKRQSTLSAMHIGRRVCKRLTMLAAIWRNSKELMYGYREKKFRLFLSLFLNIMRNFEVK